jgi:hypothetical protein
MAVYTVEAALPASATIGLILIDNAGPIIDNNGTVAGAAAGDPWHPIS